MDNIVIKLTHSVETKKRAHDSQIVRAKENLKLSHGGSSYRVRAIEVCCSCFTFIVVPIVCVFFVLGSCFVLKCFVFSTFAIILLRRRGVVILARPDDTSLVRTRVLPVCDNGGVVA